MKKVFGENTTGGFQGYQHNEGLDENVIDLGQYIRTLKRAKWLILLVTVCSLIVGVFLAGRMIPVYKATAIILADPEKPNANPDQRNVSTAMVSLFYNTQYKIINSRIIAESVVDKLGLVEQYKNAVAINGAENEAKSTIDTILDTTGLSDLFGGDDKKIVTEPTDDELRSQIAAGIQASLEVSGGKQSQIIEISFNSPYPDQAATIVNAISEAYIQFGLDTHLREVKNTESWLGEQSALLKASLQGSEARLSQYRSQEGLVDTQQQQVLVNNQLQALNNALVRAQTELSAAEEQYLAVKNVKANSPELYSLGPVLQNVTASGMVREQASLSQRVNELNERYGEKHPKMIAARSELKSATENLATEVSKVVENIGKDYRLALVQVSNIEKLIEQTRKSIQSLQAENFSLVSLERDVENNRRIYENFQVSLLQTSGSSEFNVSNVHIIDRATTPAYPFKPNIKLVLVASVLGGLGFGVLLAFLREMLDNTFKTPDGIEGKLHLTALGVTAEVIKKKSAIIPEKQYLHDPLSDFSESINTIRTGLLFSNIDKPPKTILVTSAGSDEGKSTLAINLATAFSNIGKTVLVEVDLRKPFYAQCFDLPVNNGLTDIVMDKSNIANEGLHKENNGKLSIITGGTIVRNPIEVLSSKKFEDILNTLRKHFEYIILDGPPTLPVSDSCILANKVDAVLFAVKANETKIKLAQEALSRLKKLNANVVGAVLTVTNTKKMKKYGDHFQTGEYYGVKPKEGDEPKPTAVI